MSLIGPCLIFVSLCFAYDPLSLARAICVTLASFELAIGISILYAHRQPADTLVSCLEILHIR